MAKISEACRCGGKHEAEYDEATAQAAEARHASWLDRHKFCGAENDPRMRSGGFASTSIGNTSSEVAAPAWIRTPQILGFRPNNEA